MLILYREEWDKRKSTTTCGQFKDMDTDVIRYIWFKRRSTQVSLL